MIRKFRTFEEAEEALWCAKPDVAYWRRVARIWALGRALAPPLYPPGVYRFRTIEEANEDAEARLAARRGGR